jgi:hypothetical protein
VKREPDSYHRPATENQKDDKPNQKQGKQYFGDSGCSASNSGKSQESGDERDDYKDDGPS